MCAIQQAAALGIAGGTALRGLQDTLEVRSGSTLMIIGASGGIGHLAVQIAKRMGVRVLAVASGNDGAEFVKELGADMALDGKSDDALTTARKFAPKGVDSALVAGGGKAAEAMLEVVREGGRIAHPNGVQIGSYSRASLDTLAYNADYDEELMEKLNHLATGTFRVHVGRIFPLTEVTAAHDALANHHLGRILLRVDSRK